MNIGLSRSLWLLFACGSFYFLAVFGGGFDYALPASVYHSWMALFDYDRIMAAGCFFIAACIWLAVGYPILFLGRGSSVRGMSFMLVLLLAACAALGQPLLVGLWFMLFFFFCLNTIAEGRRNGRDADSTPGKNNERRAVKIAQQPVSQASVPLAQKNAPLAAAPPPDAEDKAIRLAAEAARSRIIQSTRK